MLLSQLVLEVPNAISPAICQKYISLLEEQNSRIDQPTKHYTHRPLEHIDFTDIVDCVQGLCSTYQQSVPVFNFFNTPVKLETPVIKKYHKGSTDSFDEHMDASDFQSCSRFMAFLMYLNDVPEGGNTVFPQLGLDFKPKQGTAVVFPPQWMFKHKGERPVSNDKYIITTYFRYGE
jgi:2OG-Fe(II) oxygenase superfamily